MSDRYGKGHDNLDDAAAAALFLLSKQPRVDDQEYMGLLIKGEDGKYYRTGLQTDGRRDSSSWTGRPGGQVAGVVHSHPEHRHEDHFPSTSFSRTDVDTARDMGVPSYIVGIGREGGERKYIPDPSSSAVRSTPGKEFLAEFPWEEFKQYLMRTILERAPNDPRGLMR